MLVTLCPNRILPTLPARFFMWFSIAMLLAGSLAAQPINDNCTNASPVIISNSGFGLGLATSTQYDLTAATLQTGETFSSSAVTAGIDKKSTWYKFSLPTTRAVRISLAQPGSAIQAGNAGFSVYKTNTCIPGSAAISTKFTPIEVFGSSYHPCVESGDYLVQVTGNNSANGPIYITIDLSDTTGGIYDKPANAYQFTNITTNKTSTIDYLVQCQTIDDAAENCLPNTSFKDFTKSTWHTFTTPAYFDWFSVLFTAMDAANYLAPDYVVGYRIYQGNSRVTPVNSLVLIGGCDSLKINGYYPDKKLYKCGELLPNTAYTVQLLYHKDYVKTVRLGVSWNGVAATKGPEPISTLPTPNNMGTLLASSNGLNNTASDNLACNSRHSQHACPKSMPVAGVLNGGHRYTLSSFFSFTLATTSTLNFTISPTCGPAPLVRLYKQELTANCTDLDTANIIATFANNSGPLSCLDAGSYVLQVMGVDSIVPRTGYHWSSLSTSTSALCLQHHLGSLVNLTINAKTEVVINKFGLSATGKFDKINANGAGVMQPLLLGVTYTAVKDTFGCANTVKPDSIYCGTQSSTTKTAYREFLIADTGMLYATGFYNNMGYHNTGMLYQGDANALATAQNVFSYPQKITGLVPYSKCFVNSTTQFACVVPGTYTLSSSFFLIGATSDLQLLYKQPQTKHATPATAQDMGDLWSYLPGNTWHRSDLDTFTCRDNPDTIGGLAPCNGSYGLPAKKLIYRQFYLSRPTYIAITNYIGPGGATGSGRYNLFRGKATDGIATLTAVGAPWVCFTSANPLTYCDEMPAGWYTIVSYGSGPNYSNPLANLPTSGQYSDVGQVSCFYIMLRPACDQPKFNRPHKASIDTLTGQPYNIVWGPQTGHTAAYPVTSKKYTLNRENFDCRQDTVFIRQYMQRCNAVDVKVAFYVFKTTQESYMQIDGIADGLWSRLYAFDVRTSDSSRLKTDTSFQPCLSKQGKMEFCRLQPGTYTLLFFAPASYTCNAVTPTIYIDQVGISRFDHAANAYDFGSIKPDSAWYSGKISDVNPLNASRAASNDFFYCTTGARINDPADATCYSLYNPFIYSGTNNVVLHQDNTTAPNSSTIDRRNLWYTFTTNQPGDVRVRVDNKTPSKQHQYLFAVYKSDVDGSLPFPSVVAGGLVDSTLLSGLTLVKHNVGYLCTGSREISFYNEPCSFKSTRYYVVVENRNALYYAQVHDMNPNSQVEVSILLDSVTARPPLFDHFSQANDLGLVNSGIKRGATDNFTCATRDLTDPVYAYNACQKTLWYKFTTTVTGTIRYAAFFKNLNYYYFDHIQLFRQIKPNDSSATGLLHLPYTSTDNVNGNWARQCISPGTYYIILPGCNAVNEDVYAQIEIIPSAGDFCSVPMVTGLSGPGTRIVPVTVDCHTIGTDYGEFNPTLTCPANATTTSYKTSWYRLDITGTDTVDVTVFINEKTNAGSTDIKYRMMTGSCGAMQEQSCVQDALTRNTYKCLAPGNSYYIQVFSPITFAGQPVTGDIDLNIAAVVHADTCQPANNCIGVANFTPKFDCTKDRNVLFTNFSTYGSFITYDWDFGYNNQISNAVSPSFFYPALTTAQTYTVKLVITNTSCGKKDSSIQTITIPARPAVNFGRDTINCTNGVTVLLNATSHTSSTYYWYNGSTQPTLTVGGIASPWVEVTYNNCKARDTINIWINPIAKKPLQTVALCNVTSITLNAARGFGEQYTWNTGAATATITVAQPGYYWVDLYLNGCTVRDSFYVVSSNLRPLGNDTTVCQRNMPFTANATVNGATSYKWQNNTTAPTLSITQPGLYWVDILLGGCTFRDTLNVAVDSFKTAAITARICRGQLYMLPSGQQVNTAGLYRDTLRNSRNCDTLITTITLGVDTARNINITTSICAGQNYTLPSGTVVNASGIYNDTTRNIRGCDSIIAVVDVRVGNPVIRDTAAFICRGQGFALPSGIVLTTAGQYRDTVKSVFGCDSLITRLTLNVDTAMIVTSSATICAGRTFTLPSGTIVNTAGFYVDTVRNIRNCDSLISRITLAVTPAAFVNTSTFICAGQSYTLPSGIVVNAGGLYRDTLRNAVGCDSIISQLNLTVYSAVQRSINAGICAGQTYMLPSGTLVSTTGQYRDTLRYVGGCDSVRSIINLTVFAKTINSVSASICAGQTYTLPSGTLVNTSGLYRDSLRYTNGCDSVITNVTLTVGNPLRSILAQTICAGQAYILPSGLSINTAGIYTDTVRNTGGCDSLITTLTLRVDAATTATLSASICNGQLYTLPSGATVSAAGNYADTIRNNRGCDSIRYTVSISIRPVIRQTNMAAICSGQTYTLPGGTAISTAGIYIDTLTTALGCDSIITTTLAVRPPLTLSLSGPASICEGSAATLTATASGGTGGPYTYTWAGVTATGNTAIVNPVATTQYGLQIGDGCTVAAARDSITITVIPKPNAVFTTSALSGCQPVQINFTNSTTGVRHQWNFGTGNTADTSVLQNPSFTYNFPGIYVVRLTLTTPQGCTATSTQTVTVAPTPQGDFTQPTPVCAGSSATFTGTVNNATGISWSWDFGNGNTSNLQTPPAQTFASAGNYVIRLIVRNAAGCADTTDRTLAVAALPVPGLNNVTVKICLGASATLTAQGGVNYDWTPSLGLNNPGIAAPVASPAITTLYRVIVTNTAGCRATDSVRVQVTQPFTLVAPSDTFVCKGSSIELRASGALRYEWSGPGMSNSAIPGPIAKPGSTATYTVTGYGIDNCFTQTKTFTITVVPLPTVEAGPDTTVLVGSTFNLLPQYSSDVNQYRWAPPTYLGCTGCPVPSVTPRAATTYTISVRNAYNCEATDTRVIKLLCNNESVFVPNTFTPNGDGNNDIFYPRGEGIRTVRWLRVYNRWGQLLFEQTNFNTNSRSNGWDGTFKGQKLAPDVYVYSLGMVCDNDQLIETKGNVMIVR